MCDIRKILTPGTRWNTFGTHRGKLTQSHWLTIQKPEKKAPDMIQVRPTDSDKNLTTPWPKPEDILVIRPDFIKYKLQQTDGERTQTITVTWRKDNPDQVIDDIPTPMPQAFKEPDEYIRAPSEIHTNTSRYTIYQRCGITPPYYPSRATYRNKHEATQSGVTTYVYEAGRLWEVNAWKEFYRQYGCTPAQALARQSKPKE